eukprot:gene6303-6538_t
MRECLNPASMFATANPEVEAGERQLLADVCQAAAIAVKAQAAIAAMLGTPSNDADQTLLQADQACAAAADAIKEARQYREQLHLYTNESNKVEQEQEKLQQLLAALQETQTSAAKAQPIATGWSLPGRHDVAPFNLCNVHITMREKLTVICSGMPWLFKTRSQLLAWEVTQLPELQVLRQLQQLQLPDVAAHEGATVGEMAIEYQQQQGLALGYQLAY